uniref:Uncharacterized protein n=1 Tax=Mesocestoides corti TaxID=53468 RepID=A0A5K3FQX4_MESCO
MNSGGVNGIITDRCEIMPSTSNIDSYKPKLNITLDGSTYTKTLGLESKISPDVPDINSFGNVCGGCADDDDKSQVSNARCSVQLTPSKLPSDDAVKAVCVASLDPPCAIRPPPRCTFFTQLARRLTIRRTAPKSTVLSPDCGGSNISAAVNKKSPSQIPTGRKIRRWFSKHLMPPPKNSPHQTPPGSRSTRAATLDGIADRHISPPKSDFCSDSTKRRCMPPCNLSEPSLCNSQAGTASLADEQFDTGQNGHTCAPPSLGAARLIVTSAASSITQKPDKISTHLSSAFSSPSVTAAVASASLNRIVLSPARRVNRICIKIL